MLESSLIPLVILNPIRSSSACELENRGPQQPWPAPPSEALSGLRFPQSDSEAKPQDDEEICEGEPFTPKKEWKTTWPNFNRAQESGGKQSFVVHLPKFTTPPPLLDSLVSPCKYLLPANGGLWPRPLPPDPSQLPMPKLYLDDSTTIPTSDKKSPAPAPQATTATLPTEADLVQDSEGSCSGSELNVTDQANVSTTSTGSNVRRKLRLAAHFQTPLE
ncbi:uncharacterized protein LOC120352818 [Nilaparvata lugens]|uniref:uncharacterized protein LOC120352818 n=1 Tax=Nilaparvata lugens TaxID=108931 RepID=UPI00193DA8AE|nr:uncharacterized protein LOC120352818 [Nilaparvata lugens]